MTEIKERVRKNKTWLITALLATYLWGLAAHGYAFFDNHLTHDSLREFHSEILGNDIKLSIGRVFAPLYRDLLGSDVTLPWFTGVLALLWIGLAVFLVIRMCRIESKPTAALVAGLFCTNITVSSITATYIHDLDSYMFALLCAAGAAFLWREHPKGWMAGWVLVMVSLGIHQSYLFVTVTLAMILCILDLLNGTAYREVFQKGWKAVGMILLGGAAYVLAMKLLLGLFGAALSQGDYNSLDRMKLLELRIVGALIAGTYRDWFSRLWNAYSSYPSILIKAMTALFFLIDLTALAVGFVSKKLGWKEKLLCAGLAILLPLGMNMIFVLSVGEVHDLMVFPVWLFYLFTLLMARWLWQQWKGWKIPAGNWQKAVCMLLVGVLLYGNVRFSNGMYVKKSLEYDAYLSLMTRVVGRMEAVEGYQPGETPVVFVGLPRTFNRVIPGFKDYWNVTGMTISNPIVTTEISRFQAYFDYVMSLPINLVDEKTWVEMQDAEDLREMPSYPSEGFLAFRDGILVVKLGDIGH